MVAMIFPDIDELKPILNSRLVPSGRGKVVQLSNFGKSNMVSWMKEGYNRPFSKINVDNHFNFF
jgi:hypothetical protein